MSVSDVSHSLQLSFNHPSVVLTADVFQYFCENFVRQCCCLHIQPFFLPNDISSSTPSVLVDYQVPGMNKCVGYIVSSLAFRFDVLAYFIGFFECLIIRSAYLSVEWTQLKVVLAYSGGLDTSVILKWLSSQGFEVIW